MKLFLEKPSKAQFSYLSIIHFMTFLLNTTQNTLEDCVVCDKKITERILKAVGKSYHPKCFTCTSCTKSLDGIPFTLDTANKVHCVECYQV